MFTSVLKQTAVVWTELIDLAIYIYVCMIPIVSHNTHVLLSPLYYEHMLHGVRSGDLKCRLQPVPLTQPTMCPSSLLRHLTSVPQTNR